MNVTQTQAHAASIINGFSQLPTVYALAAALPVVFALWGFSKSRSPIPIVNGEGKVLPHADEDTRFSRFSHGKELGDKFTNTLGPIYTFQSGNARELVLTTPEDIKTYYKDALGREEDKAHKKSLIESFGNYMGRFLGHSVGFQHGKEWKRIRDGIDPHFIRKIAFEAIPLMKYDFVDWISKVHTSDSTNPKNPKSSSPFEIQAIAATRELPFKAISKSTYGETLTEEWYARLWKLHPFHDTVMAQAIGNQTASHWWYRFLPTEANRALKTFKEGYRAFNLDIIAESERKGYDTVATKMYSSVVDGIISESEFHETLDEILFANIDITSVAQAWLLIDIGLHLDLQEKLRAEIAAVNENDPKALEGYLASKTNLLHYVLSESSRLHPVLWFNIPEVISVEKIINGYQVPKGTSVCISTYHLNTNKDVWGPDAAEFRPSRFKEVPANTVRYGFWQYGLGPRQCLGKHFAGIIVKLCVMKTLQKYKIETISEIGYDRTQFTTTPQALLRFTPL